MNKRGKNSSAQPFTDLPPNGLRLDLHWLTLKFSASEDVDLESRFLEKYFYRNLKHLRYCHFYTIAFYLFAGWVDYLLFPEDSIALLSIRFLVVVPVVITGYLFTHSRYYKVFWQEISFFYILLTGGSFIAFTMIAKPPAAYDYYVGIFFCMVFGYAFIRERFFHATIAGSILACGYLFSSALITKMPAQFLFHSNFYLFLVNFLGMIIARHLEISARRDFYLEYKLTQEQDKVVQLNNSLEQKVVDRTRELERSNQMLKDKITELNSSETERHKLESQLRQASKMEAIGTLAGGIAHDFNNILSAVIGYTELALMDVEKDSRIEKNLQAVYIAGNRAKDLVKQILAFSRQTDEAPKPVQVHNIVKEVVKLLQSTIPSNIEIRSDIQSRSFIIGDPINIHQVVMNLAANAAHAMEDGGVMTIRLSDVTLDGNAAKKTAALKTGEYLKVSVADTGKGIPSKIIESIFEPYFTTKNTGEGTGMGLAVVYGIVKKYHGEVTVDSHPEKGSVFSVYFPITDRRENGELFQLENLPSGSERILLVDDEPNVAKIACEHLQMQGFKVTIRTSSVEALSFFRARPHDFDLVITDMTMPDMTGEKLAAELLKIKPELPIILCTGYSNKISEDTARKLGIKAFAIKPIAKTDLLKTVRNVLDAADEGI